MDCAAQLGPAKAIFLYLLPRSCPYSTMVTHVSTTQVPFCPHPKMPLSSLEDPQVPKDRFYES